MCSPDISSVAVDTTQWLHGHKDSLYPGIHGHYVHSTRTLDECVF